MNKKIVFLIVILECILAVFIVSIFGSAIEDARSKILCRDLYFVYAEDVYEEDKETGEMKKVGVKGEKIEDGVMITVNPTDANMSYQLVWVMETDKTSNKEVLFTSSKPNRVTVNPDTGLVTFLEKTDVVITIEAKDGSGKMDSITLVSKRGGGIAQ